MALELEQTDAQQCVNLFRSVGRMKAAIFDIAGVLTKGFAVQHFWDYLAEKGAINSADLLSSKRIFDEFKKGRIRYRELVDTSMKHVALSFRGANQKEISDLSKEFFGESEIDIFSYTVPLLRFLKDKDFRIIAISGSNIEFIENYKILLGLDEVYGTEFVVEDGRYTGSIKLNVGLGESKKSIMNSLTSEKRIGFGDTDQDIHILNSVEIPVAVNPSKELERIARKKRWPVIRENDDVVEKVRELIE